MNKQFFTHQTILLAYKSQSKGQKRSISTVTSISLWHSTRNYIYQLPFFQSPKIKWDVLFQIIQKELTVSVASISVTYFSESCLTLPRSCGETHLEHIMFILTCLFIPFFTYWCKSKAFLGSIMFFTLFMAMVFRNRNDSSFHIYTHSQ